MTPDPYGQRLDDFERDYKQQATTRRRRWQKWLVFPSLAGVAAADFFVPRHHSEYLWDALPTFYAFYGLFAALLIVLFSKGIGKRLARPEERQGHL
jgi:hypothetical protein